MMIMTHFPEKYENLAKKVEIFSSFCLQTVHSMSPGNNVGNGNTVNFSAGIFNSKNNKKRDEEEDGEGNRKPSDDVRDTEDEKKQQDAARKREQRAFSAMKT